MPDPESPYRSPNLFNLSSIYHKTIFLIKSLFIKQDVATSDSFYEAILNLQSQSKKMSSEERHLLGNFLQFCNKTVEDVMIPRSDIFALKSDATLEDAKKAIVESGHTRTLIYEDTLDNVVGFVHMKDVFEIIVNKQQCNLKKIMRKHITTAPSMKLIDLLADMQKKRTHIAVIIDEYGGTDGMATIEDIMESIVDKIEDEHDDESDENQFFKVVSDNEIIASARVEIEEIEKILNMKLKSDDDECDTIGGLVIARIGKIPDKGAVIEITNRVKVEVTESTKRALKMVKIIISQ